MLEIAIALVPLFLLVASLLFGHYPGLTTIVRISERLASGRPARAARHQPRPRTLWMQAIRGGRLLASGFAQRPPPLTP